MRSARLLVHREGQRALGSKRLLYEKVTDRAEIERRQVERFNEVWADCLARIPFYQAWAREHDLPRRVDAPADILMAFPPLTKRVVVDREREILLPGTSAISTGGSEGQPARFPSSAADGQAAFANLYLGRGWWSIHPFDPHIMLWGHAHLFGSGWRGRAAQIKRAAADRALGITRLNAYDMRDDAVARYARAIRRADPVFVLGYTSAVFRLAKHMVSYQGRRLRAVILTSETVSEADAVTISAAFNAPVVIEYGSAETGVVACSRGHTWQLQVFWDSFIALVGEDGALTLTVLNRQFPLINYRIGDLVDSEPGNALTFNAVRGRAQDVVRLSTMSGGELTLSAILPVHILKTHPGIRAVQFQQEPHRLNVFYEADQPIDPQRLAAFFLRELRRDHPEAAASAVRFEQVASTALTRAGKHQLFRES